MLKQCILSLQLLQPLVVMRTVCLQRVCFSLQRRDICVPKRLQPAQTSSCVLPNACQSNKQRPRLVYRPELSRTMLLVASNCPSKTCMLPRYTQTVLTSAGIMVTWQTGETQVADHVIEGHRMQALTSQDEKTQAGTNRYATLPLHVQNVKEEGLAALHLSQSATEGIRVKTSTSAFPRLLTLYTE